MKSEWIDKENKYYMQTVRRQPIVLVKGEGTRAWDDFGKEYLDFVAGWAVNSIGHSHPVIVNAAIEQAKTLLQTSNQFYTIPQVELAQLLIENSVLDRVFFANSGAEANEGAVKLARKFGKVRKKGAYEIITALNSFHGRTLSMVAATGQPQYQGSFTPMTDGFKYVPFGDFDEIKASTSDKTVAVLIEPVQGEGGVNIPYKEYLKDIRAWCDKNGLLLILDEVQTGLGRLGTLWGYESFDVIPDVITLGKGLGGGAPIGAFLARQDVAVLEPGDHGSTFGGNALTCAIARNVVRYIIENNLIDNVQIMSNLLISKLEDLKSSNNSIKEVRGMGLLIAVEFESEISSEIITKCNENGLLLNAVRPNAVRFMPPLTVNREEIIQAVERFESSLM
ncbi:MAG: aspartate aminotransferase family protein [SAR202 cluster bacterium]|nr:aspartate aminotransferase family protein [SAR202 cluster bacterium]|tara:strand:- start:418 stop:1596 length:1179 start_codon:yes stop_codon:yes gene_type:complete